MNSWKKLNEILKIEAFDDDDAELDVQTSPYRSFSDPFNSTPVAKAKVQDPGTKMSIGKPKPTLAPPSSNAIQKAKAVQASNFGDTSKPSSLPKPYVKPNYKGSFVGQVWKTNSKVVNKSPMAQDKQTGTLKHIGDSPTQTYAELVWDGNDWVTKAAWDMKNKNGKK